MPDEREIGDRKADAVYAAELSRDLALIARHHASMRQATSWETARLDPRTCAPHLNGRQT
jgi:hypothetical protein